MSECFSYRIPLVIAKSIISRAPTYLSAYRTYFRSPLIFHREWRSISYLFSKRSNKEGLFKKEDMKAEGEGGGNSNSNDFKLNNEKQKQKQKHEVYHKETPNPSAFIFGYRDLEILEDGDKSLAFHNRHHCRKSSLAKGIFSVWGVASVTLYKEHLTVNKKAEALWDELIPDISDAMQHHINSGEPFVEKEEKETDIQKEKEKEKETGNKISNSIESTLSLEKENIVSQIIDVLDRHIRPLIQEDGGDVEFVEFDFEEGRVFLEMTGACVGCPKSSITLKMGIERMLCYYVPEVKEVVNVNNDETNSEW